MIIKYDLIGRTKAGITAHPQEDFQERGIEVFHHTYVGYPIGDFVIFQVHDYTNLALLPSYVAILGENDANLIEDYHQRLRQLSEASRSC